MTSHDSAFFFENQTLNNNRKVSMTHAHGQL